MIQRNAKRIPEYDIVCECGVCPICLELAEYDKPDCNCGECLSCRENARWDAIYAKHVSPAGTEHSGVSSCLAAFG